VGAPGAGLVISGAKVVATGSVLTNYAFVAHHGLIPVQDKKFAAVFILPTNSPGVNPISAIRASSAITQCAEPSKSQALVRQTVCRSVTAHREMAASRQKWPFSRG
jgi:aromatic ring hydroxylase